MKKISFLELLREVCVKDDELDLNDLQLLEHAYDEHVVPELITKDTYFEPLIMMDKDGVSYIFFIQLWTYFS